MLFNKARMTTALDSGIDKYNLAASQVSKEIEYQLKKTKAAFLVGLPLVALERVFAVYKHTVPKTVVSHAVLGLYSYMYALGSPDTGAEFIFFTDGAGRYYEAKREDGIPMVNLVNRLPEIVARGLVYNIVNEAIPAVGIPRSFYVFHFTAQWAGGGYEGEKSEKEFVCQANSDEEAVGKLLGYQSLLHENIAERIMVNYGDGWKYMHIIERSSGRTMDYLSMGILRYCSISIPRA